MKSISIYALTRKQNIEHLQKLEQQLSGREHMLKMKEWEQAVCGEAQGGK